MNYLNGKSILSLTSITLVGILLLVSQEQVKGQNPSAQIQATNVPHYLQSPISGESYTFDGETPGANGLQQRSLQTPSPQIIMQDVSRNAAMNQVNPSQNSQQILSSTQNSLIPSQQQQQALGLETSARSGKGPISNLKPPQVALPSSTSGQQTCLYDKRYFDTLDSCLSRRPYPTVGLSAFKNEDLLVKIGLSERRGCQFVLNNGLFKNYHITRYNVDNDNQCLDGSKVGLQLAFNNVSLAYLWNLRCLNHADQLLEDSTLGGKTMTNIPTGEPTATATSSQSSSGICVGSSQNFGFTCLQLTSLEAQVELVADIYKNWRVTNITVAMVNPPPLNAGGSPMSNNLMGDRSPQDHNPENGNTEVPVIGTNIKDFVFESLDGDELNWRYMHLYQNWARNKLHTTFLDQYRRFLWISLQRCLSEASEKLPVKLFDMFLNDKLN